MRGLLLALLLWGLVAGPLITATGAQTLPIPSARLQWSGVKPEQLQFMRRVYDRQMGRANGEPTGDMPAAQLGAIEGRQRALKETAQACRTLLKALRSEIARRKQAKLAAQGDRITVISAYRPASRQFANWQKNFPNYYQQTRAQRSGLPGGEHGDEAVEYLAQYVGRRLAPPGFSLHNEGLAIDFGGREGARQLTVTTGTANIRHWRASWLFQWLSDNASDYGFHQNLRIDEPWHWEYRGTAAE
ncbi:MAG: D-alanyl-D-alanine carboxypeptidase family protein [Gemmatimonadaceae bacterium]|nr:D-alanyl-D-alanine carboxypeptidase family protein [Gloeobacterales cyanobacterium ES-bin-141]